MSSKSLDYPTFSLKDKVALITGAGRGLGKSCALALANAGADIALGLRDVNTALELESEIKAMGRRVIQGANGCIYCTGN